MCWFKLAEYCSNKKFFFFRIIFWYELKYYCLKWKHINGLEIFSMNKLIFFRGVQEVLYLYLIYTYVQSVFNSFDKLCLISDSKSRYFAAICVLLLMNMYLPTGQGAPLGVWYMQTHIILYFCCDSLTKVEFSCTSTIKLNLLEFMYSSVITYLYFISLICYFSEERWFIYMVHTMKI